MFKRITGHEFKMQDERHRPGDRHKHKDRKQILKEALENKDKEMKAALEAKDLAMKSALLAKDEEMKGALAKKSEDMENALKEMDGIISDKEKRLERKDMKIGELRAEVAMLRQKVNEWEEWKKKYDSR